MELATRLMENVRWAAFWTLDLLTGGQVLRGVAELRRLGRLGITDSRVSGARKRALDELLRHAVETVPFYRSTDTSGELGSFPVIDKDALRASQGQFVSSKHFDTVYTMRTSGSTGAPFAIEQDGRKKRRVQAELIYFSSKLGWRVGLPLPFLRIKDPSANRTPLKQWLTNNQSIDVSRLEPLAIARSLSRMKGGVLLSYASTLDALAHDALSMRPFVHGVLSGIISGAEALDEDTRNEIEDCFGCPCVSRYSNQENGVIAQEDHEKCVFALNSVNYWVEVLDLQDDTELSEGSVGRIVVTDLYNYRTPLIRYDTGDLGALKTESGSDGRRFQVLKHLSGRRWDHLFSQDGAWVSAHVLTNMFRNEPQILHFRCTQHDWGRFTLELQVEDAFSSEDAVIARLRGVLGEDARITVKYADHLEPASSGKRRVVVNQILQRQAGNEPARSLGQSQSEQ